MKKSKNMNQYADLETLPKDILYRLMQELSVNDILNVGTLNHFFKTESEKNIVWKHLVNQQYSGIHEIILNVLLKEANDNYKLLFQKLYKANKLIDQFSKKNHPLISRQENSEALIINSEPIKNELISQDKKYMWTVLLLRKNVLFDSMILYFYSIHECYKQYFNDNDFPEHLLLLAQDKIFFQTQGSYLEFRRYLLKLNANDEKQFKILFISLLNLLKQNKSFTNFENIIDFLIYKPLKEVEIIPYLRQCVPSVYSLMTDDKIKKSSKKYKFLKKFAITEQWRSYTNDIIKENFSEYLLSVYINNSKIEEVIQILTNNPKFLETAPLPFEQYVKISIQNQNPVILNLLFKSYKKPLNEEQISSIINTFFQHIEQITLYEEANEEIIDLNYDDWEKIPRTWVQIMPNNSDIKKIAAILFKNRIDLLDAFHDEKYKKWNIQLGEHNGFYTILTRKIKDSDLKKSKMNDYNNSRYVNFQKWLQEIRQSFYSQKANRLITFKSLRK